jgi:ABC-type antimicrobial peptide transport system permease subunit
MIVGLALALSMGRVMQALLYGVSAADPLILASVAFVVLVVALIASYVPARRAAKADPMTALRAE